MQWKQYYQDRPLSLDSFIGDIWEHRPFLGEIVASAEKHKPILEVGSGSGALCSFLSHLGFQAISIDNEPAVLEIANRNSKSVNAKVTFRRGDAFGLPFPDDSYNVCFSQGFFEHFSNSSIVKLLKEQLRVSGVVLFSVPSFWYPVQDFGNERLMKRDQWLKALKKFKVTKSAYYVGTKGLKSRPSQIFFKIMR